MKKMILNVLAVCATAGVALAQTPKAKPIPPVVAFDISKQYRICC